MIKKTLHIVFCIDTNSTSSRYLDNVKSRVINLYAILQSTALKWEVELTEVKVKIIIYGSKSKHLKESRWYNISESRGLSKEYLFAFSRKIKCEETNEDSLGLESLLRAINCDWPPVEERYTKQVIILHSDSASNVIDEKLFHEVTNSWMNNHISSNLKQRSKRLILLTPDVYPWVDIYQYFDQTILSPMEIDNDVEYFDVISPLLYNSL